MRTNDRPGALWLVAGLALLGAACGGSQAEPTPGPSPPAAAAKAPAPPAPPEDRAPEGAEESPEKPGPARADRDGDGYPDAKDKCPGEAEVYNDVDDGDGCPEGAPALATLEGDEIRLSTPVEFKPKTRDLRKKSLPALRAVAALVRAHGELPGVVVVHRYETKKACEADLPKGSKLAKGRPRAVADELLRAGVDPSRVRAQGARDFGPRTRQIGPGISILVATPEVQGDAVPTCEDAAAP